MCMTMSLHCQMPRLKTQRIEPMIAGSVIAAVHGVSRRTITRWAESGQFGQVIRHDNGTISVPISDYQRWVNAHRLQFGG